MTSPWNSEIGVRVMQVSICMITYNHEKYIEQAIQSVLEQDVNFEYEIVVGEDCSTDETASILRKLERQNQNRLKVIYRPANIGSKANFLSTLSVCNGEYVAFLDGDDYWVYSNKLQLQVDFLDNNRCAAAVFHRTRVINGELIGLPPIIPAMEPSKFFSLEFFLTNGNQFSISSLLARRDCLRNVGSWLAHIRPGDWAVFMMLATHGDLGFIPLEMSHYRVHPTGSWNRLSDHHRMALVVQMLGHVMGLVSDKDRERVESVKFAHANWWSSELIASPSVSVEAATHELNEIADFRLSNDLLAQLVAIARAKAQAQQSCENEAKALRASAAQATQDAAEALSANQKLCSTIHGQQDRIAELQNVQNLSRSMIEKQHAAIAGLQSENARYHALVNRWERDAHRTRWLLGRLGEKIRHCPRDLSRRVRAFLRKERQSS